MYTHNIFATRVGYRRERARTPEMERQRAAAIEKALELERDEHDELARYLHS